MDTNIKLALSGQIYNTSAVLVDTLGCERTDACWHSLPADAGSIAYLFKDVTETLEGYLMWHDAQHGLYVAYAKKSARRNGYAMITLCLGHKYIVNAAEFVDGLSCLLQEYMSVGSLVEVDKMHVQTLLNVLSGYLNVCISSSIFSTKSNAPLAYTTYSDKQQLYDILSYPNQEIYGTFSKLYIIDQANAQPVVSGYQLLKINLKKEFLIKADSVSESGTVRCDKTMVGIGDQFTLTYTPKGYAPITKTETAGHDTDYSHFDEVREQIVVTGYDKIQDKLKRCKRFSFEVRSADSHQSISGCKVYVDGQIISVDKNNMLVYNFEDKQYNIEIVAGGYERLKDTLDVRKQNDGDKLPYDLKPAVERVPISVRYKNEVYSGKVELTTDNKLYRPLYDLSNKVLAPGDEKGTDKKPFLKILILIIIAILFGGGGYWLGYKSGTDATESKYDKVKKAWLNHDENYLRSNTTWKLADMQSEPYKKVLEEFLKGEEVRIPKEFNNTYNEVKFLMDSLKKYDASAPKALLKNSNGEVNLQQLKADLPSYITEVAESKDSTYLVSHNIWKKSDLISEKYKERFMKGWESGNVKVAKHPELDANVKWKEIRNDIATKSGMKELIKNHYANHHECIDLEALVREIYPNGRGGTGSGRSQGGSPGNSGGNQTGVEVTSQQDDGAGDPNDYL